MKRQMVMSNSLLSQTGKHQTGKEIIMSNMSPKKSAQSDALTRAACFSRRALKAKLVAKTAGLSIAVDSGCAGMHVYRGHDGADSWLA